MVLTIRLGCPGIMVVPSVRSSHTQGGASGATNIRGNFGHNPGPWPNGQGPGVRS